MFHTRCLLPPRSSPTGRRTCSGCPGARRTGCSTGRPGGPPARASGTVRSRISILSRSVCQQQQQQSLYQVTQHYLCTVSGCVDRRIQECPLLPASVRQGWRPRVPLQRRWPGQCWIHIIQCVTNIHLISGHTVTGVEGVPFVVEQFFRENKLEYEKVCQVCVVPDRNELFG